MMILSCNRDQYLAIRRHSNIWNRMLKIALEKYHDWFCLDDEFSSEAYLDFDTLHLFLLEEMEDLCQEFKYIDINQGMCFIVRAIILIAQEVNKLIDDQMCWKDHMRSNLREFIDTRGLNIFPPLFVIENITKITDLKGQTIYFTKFCDLDVKAHGDLDIKTFFVPDVTEYSHLINQIGLMNVMLTPINHGKNMKFQMSLFDYETANLFEGCNVGEEKN